jgi:hypothetical protein
LVEEQAEVTMDEEVEVAEPAEEGAEMRLSFGFVFLVIANENKGN